MQISFHKEVRVILVDSVRPYGGRLCQLLLCALVGSMNLGVIAAARAQAEQWYVDSARGHDAGAGSAAEPFKTVDTAIKRATPGATITLQAGWYDGNIVMKPGEPQKPITLRAAQPGRVFIGKPKVVRGLQRLPGQRFTYAAPLDQLALAMVESDSGTTLRHMGAIEDVEELAGSYFWDEASKQVYIHACDSQDASAHTYLYTLKGVDATGVEMASYTIVDGLVVSGFSDAGIGATQPLHAVVQNCIVHANGFGIQFTGGSDCVIRGNTAWGNRPSYHEGAQIYIGGDPLAERYLVENNVAFDSPTRMGIRFYGASLNCVTRGNLVYNNMIGFYYKAGDKSQVAEYNMGFGNLNGSVEAEDMRHNTYDRFRMMHSGIASPTDLNLEKFAGDPRFADPSHHDYRLQSDSPARGRSPDGKDLGALQYDGSVVYVSSAGNDANDGTSISKAWMTLGHAAAKIKAGQTLYIEPGSWDQPLVIQGLQASDDKPTIIRVRTGGSAAFPGVRIEDTQNLRLEGMKVHKGSGIVVRGSRGIELKQVVATGNMAPGLVVEKSQNIQIDSSALAYNQGAGLELGAGCAEVAVVSSMLFANGKAQITMADKTPGFYSQFNALGEGPLGARGGAETAVDLPAWRAKLGGGETDMIIALKDLADPVNGNFAVRAGSDAAIGGRFAKPVGPAQTFAGAKQSFAPLDFVEVLSTTRTTANLNWYTPGKIVGTMVQWGKTSDYGQVQDRSSFAGTSEYHTFHTASLVGLEPSTRYHFRVGFIEWSGQVQSDPGAHPTFRKEGSSVATAPVVWSEDHTFVTASEDPAPRQLYVSLQGNDQNDGLSPQKAWRSVRKAAREARAGDTVTLAPGRYVELLRPLQTGASADRRITYRAEKPLTVYLDGNFIKFVRDARAHCIEIDSKAYITLENLALQGIAQMDYGGYRDGFGNSGMIRISGSAGLEIKGCVMDGRERWMPAIWANDAGLMPGVPEDVPAFVASDCAFVWGYRTYGYSQTRPAIIEHCLLLRAVTGQITEVGPLGKLIMRNNIITDHIKNKSGVPLFGRGWGKYEFDYNCYHWLPANEDYGRFIVDGAKGGLKPWQEKTGQDKHSIEAECGMPLYDFIGDGFNAQVNRTDALKIEQLILKPDSPCRKAGMNGEDIGPRWEKFLK